MTLSEKLWRVQNPDKKYWRKVEDLAKTHIKNMQICAKHGRYVSGILRKDKSELAIDAFKTIIARNPDLQVEITDEKLFITFVLSW